MNVSRACYKLNILVAFGMLLTSMYTHADEAELELRDSYTQGNNDSLVELALYHYARVDNEAGTGAASAVVAFDLLTIAANRHNNPVAQVNLGVLYQFGDGVEVNHARAAYWYDRAATGGNLSAVVKLADLYSRGIGTEVNPGRASTLYTEAAEAGLPEAQVELGYIYEMGDLGEVDYRSAIKWYQKAADNGDEIAQYNLAEIYELGKGVPVNFEKAKEFYGLAAQQGLPEAEAA